MQFSYCDIRDYQKLSAILTKTSPDYIYNLAAHFANQNSVDFPFQDIETNITGVVNILEVAKKLTSLKKVVFASSSCVYGDNENMFEAAQVEPIETPYAINKFVGELYAKYYARQFGVKTCTARIFNTYGPGELDGKYRNVIPNFIAKALRGEDIQITGTGKESRDFTYTDDTCALLIKLAECEYKSGEVFNSGTGKETTIQDLVSKIVSLTNSSSDVVYAPKREWDGVDSRVSLIEQSKLRLDYKPRVSLDEGLDKTVEWFREQLA